MIGARLIDVDPVRPGREIRLRLVTFADAHTRPRLVRRQTRLYAYDPATDRYVSLPTRR